MYLVGYDTTSGFDCYRARGKRKNEKDRKKKTPRETTHYTSRDDRDQNVNSRDPVGRGPAPSWVIGACPRAAIGRIRNDVRSPPLHNRWRRDSSERARGTAASGVNSFFPPKCLCCSNVGFFIFTLRPKKYFTYLCVAAQGDFAMDIIDLTCRQLFYC